MSISLHARKPGVRSFQFTNGSWFRICQLGALLPAGVLAPQTANHTYFRDEYGNPYDGSLKVPEREALAVAMCAEAIQRGLDDGIRLGREWVTTQDREIARWRMLEGLATFCQECGGFDVS